MNRANWTLLALLLALALPFALLLLRPDRTDHGDSLLFYCAAGMRKPITAIAERYEQEFGISVDLQFAGSGTLLGNIEASATGDLYLAADSSYIEIARKKGLVEESLPIAFLTGGLAVQKGNPKELAALSDLRDRDDLRITLANPEATSVGKFTRKVLQKAGLWDAVEKKTLVMKPTVNELANDIKLGAADVAIVWDAVAGQYPDLDFIHVPEFDAERKDVTVGVFSSARNPAAALRFARYATASDRGLAIFRQDGYEIIDGDKWEPEPELLFFSGAMLQPAIRTRMERFEQREGVRVNFVPNGCGILVSQMRAGARPDAYFSCDISFMESVQDLFNPATTVSANDIVILVANKARDKVVQPADLAKPGIKIGVAHPEKSALGALTTRLLDAMAIDVSQTKQLDSATGDFLVNQLRAGSLDAVLVYRSNAMAHQGTLEDGHLVEIDHALAHARQPFAVGRNSDHKNLSQRLFDALTAEAGKAEFEKYGFHWELSQ